MDSIRVQEKCCNTKVTAESLSTVPQSLLFKKQAETLNSLESMSLEEVAKLLHELQVHQIELEMQNEELSRLHVELDTAKSRYLNLYNMAPIGYMSTNEQGVILDANLTAATMFEIALPQLIKESFLRFIFTEDQDHYYLKRKEFFASEEPVMCEIRMVKSSGTSFWAFLAGKKDQFIDGQAVLNIAISDITEHRRVQEALKQSEEMLIINSRQAAMGEMISMIAHQWRQPLNIMGLAIANIQTKQALEIITQAELDDKLAIVSSNISYMSDTIDDFRDFFKPEQSKEQIMMENVIKSLLDITGKTFENEKITLKIQNNSHRSLLLFKNKLIQVALNLLDNAKYALKSNKVKNATISITIHEIEDSLTIAICDNAGGIPEEVLAHLGEPYFTTKKLNGTGLGLHIARTILEKYFKGTLTWYNEKQGACFLITLNTK